MNIASLISLQIFGAVTASGAIQALADKIREQAEGQTTQYPDFRG